MPGISYVYNKMYDAYRQAEKKWPFSRVTGLCIPCKDWWQQVMCLTADTKQNLIGFFFAAEE